jgi:hypothetical protein
LCSAEQDSQTGEEQVLSISSENTSLKMKAKKVSGEEHVDDVNDTIETDELNKDTTRLKQSEPESKIVKATTKKKRMVKSDEVSGCVLNSRLCRIIYFLL